MENGHTRIWIVRIEFDPELIPDAKKEHSNQILNTLGIDTHGGSYHDYKGNHHLKDESMKDKECEGCILQKLVERPATGKNIIAYFTKEMMYIDNYAEKIDSLLLTRQTKI